MDDLLSKIKLQVFDLCDLKLTDFVKEIESKEYNACRFKIDEKQIICRSSKITPKKTGQFVTFYKRNKTGVIEPFFENDNIDFFQINITYNNKFGVFLFPKSELIKRGIISTSKKEGKRAFRVYPYWYLPTSKQALATQKWQSKYFYPVTDCIDKDNILKLLSL